MLQKVFLCALLVAVTGCAKTRVELLLDQAEESLENAEPLSAYVTLRPVFASLRLTAEEKEALRELLADYPELGATALEATQQKLTHSKQSDKAADLASLPSYVVELKRVGIVSHTRFEELQSEARAVLEERITAAKVSVSLDDIGEQALSGDHDLAGFWSKAALRAAFQVQLAAIPSAPDRLNKTVFAYIGSHATDDEVTALRRLVAAMPWQERAEWRAFVAKRWPDWYQQVRQEAELPLQLVTIPEKPLLALDLTELLGKHDLLKFGATTKDGVVIEVRELQYEERETPETVRQQFVPYLAMNFAARLFYPQNATAIYDLHSGTTEILYAYQLRLLQDGTLQEEKLLRDSSKNSYEYGANLRFENVYGGTGVSPIYPNDMVQRLFVNGARKKDISVMRKEVVEKVAQAISSFAAMKTAIQLSQK